VINSRVQASGKYYHELRVPMLSLVRGNPKRVLEIGCASGHTMSYLRDHGAEHTIGVEYSPDAAALTKRAAWAGSSWETSNVWNWISNRLRSTC
jgi:spermidine synthase